MTAAHPNFDAGLPALPEVLLVDDDDVRLLLTELALHERGFKLVCASSGEQALALLQGHTPDIVVLDALMPGLDGFETCRALRRLPGHENVPVLMLTGLDDDASITRAYQAGATDFFVKSTQWSLLAGRLQYLLRASRTRLELERSKSKLARAQDLARMGSFDWWRTDQGKTGGLLMSPEALRVFGCGPHEAVSLRGLLRMVPQDDRLSFLRQLHAALRHAAVVATDVPIVLFDGRQRIIHVEAEPEFNEHGHGAGYTGIVQDVTERRVAEDKIRQLANFDALTGLPNRRQLIWRAERALEQARRMGHQFALLLIDLDRFKVINDTLGHGAGDEALVEAGRRLRACVRHSDQLMEGALETAGLRSHRALEAIGRLGGDEFVALLPEVASEDDAARVAERVLEALREPIIAGGQECFVTASVGVALYPRDGASVVDLLRNSDVAMYSVKLQGKNASAIYSPQLAGRGREKLELETALHKAIERDELVLHYQPKIDVRASRMVGAEALMRWQRGGRLVPPADFIPLAEDTGLIVPLSEWALRETAKQASAWQRAFGFADSIAVNMPSRLFERSDLVEHIHQCVTAVSVPHRMIQLEITEDNLMKELQNVIPALHRLNEIGVEISIDDFGTGYSSLAYLTTLPISELKIDRSFVRDLGITPQSSAVVTAIIALARSLGLRVIAEGVETLRQMEVLHRLGCGLMQGFLFSRALPPDELQHWLENTVLPRKAPWIGPASDKDPEVDAARVAGGQALIMVETHRTAPSTAALARGALHRLVQAHLEPTPENYARAYAEEAGHPAAVVDPRAQAGAWAALVERLARSLDRRGVQWTAARRKESLRRLFESSRSDAPRLLQGLQVLMTAWDDDVPADAADTGFDDPLVELAALPAAASPAASAAAWKPVLTVLENTVRAALPPDEPRAAELAPQLAAVVAALGAEGPGAARLDELEELAQRTRRLFAHRHELVAQLGGLCHELTQGLTELAEDDSWARGQCANLQARMAEGLSARGVRAASVLLAETRERQRRVRLERQTARDGLKQLMHSMLVEVAELGEQTGRMQTATEQHVSAIESADTLEGLAGIVQAMLADSRAMHSAVRGSQERLQVDSARASGLEQRVQELEAESRRLSEEVSTDALTQVANRRGLMKAFDGEVARSEREGGTLAVGLIDIDNFKKLNDSLGHAAGDVALKSLVASVRERLRPGDQLARFGGEEFVVLLPRTDTPEAQQTLTRLQRSLTEALFLYEGREVFVTFSAGVTAWRPGETLETALERADEALYEAKRTGKNRTCMA